MRKMFVSKVGNGCGSHYELHTKSRAGKHETQVVRDGICGSGSPKRFSLEQALDYASARGYALVKAA